jgi:predicted DNA-binding transcriptional regulator YafY
MPINKKQVIRLLKINTELGKNSYPNSTSLADMFRKADIDENTNISCSERTVQRDIAILKKDFHAPIKFDSAQNGYYLTNSSWEFKCPILCEDLMTSALLGARIAEDITPQPLKGMISKSIDTQMTTNNSSLLDVAFMKSLIIASGIKATVDPKVFKAVFDGWRNHEAIRFTYRKTTGEESKKYFEPHLISFRNGIWYTKGISLPDGNEVVYAIQRISDVEMSGKFFEIDKNIVKKVQEEGLFNYNKIENIKLLCDSSIGFYLNEHQKIKKFKLTEQEDGNLLVELAPAIEHEVVRWVLGEAGKIQVLEPAYLRKKIASSAQKTLQVNS